MLVLAISACGGSTDTAGDPPRDRSSSDAAATAGDGAQGDTGKAVKAPEQEPERPEASRMVIVVIDAMRADGLGCYGYDKPTSPTIDRLASQGVVFERMHSASPWTAPSFGTIFTGVSPQVHGAGGFLAKGSPKGETLFGVTVGGIRKDLPTLPQLLPDDLETGAIINNSFVSKELGFARGMDQFDHKIARLMNYRTADEVTDLALAWLGANRDKSFMYMVHYFDPHIQYGPPKKYLPMFAPDKPRRIGYPFVDHDPARVGTLKPNDREKAFIRGLYDGEVRFTDDELTRLVEAMEKMGLMDNTWLVITSDHGEEHFDHGSFEHGHRYEEEVVRVPFIVRAPGGKWKAGTRVPTAVSHVDILPTVLDLFGANSPDHLEGSSVLPIIEDDQTADRPAYMEYNLFNGQQCAYFDGRYKIVLDLRRKRAFMYDLKEDPGEKNQLHKEHPHYEKLMGKLMAKREELAAAAKGKVVNKGQLSAEAAEALKGLGYIKE